MSTNPPDPKRVVQYLRAAAATSEDKNTLVARVHTDQIEAIARIIVAKHPDADEKQIGDALVEIEGSKPDKFRPHVMRRNVSGLTPAQKLAVANGDDPIDLLRWKRTPKGST